jgi:hypothetical protein
MLLPLLHRNIPGIHFCQRLSQSQGDNVAGRIMKIKNLKTSLRFEPTNFRFVEYYVNSLRYEVSQEI